MRILTASLTAVFRLEMIGLEVLMTGLAALRSVTGAKFQSPLAVERQQLVRPIVVAYENRAVANPAGSVGMEADTVAAETYPANTPRRGGLLAQYRRLIACRGDKPIAAPVAVTGCAIARTA